MTYRGLAPLPSISDLFRFGNPEGRNEPPWIGRRNAMRSIPVLRNTAGPVLIGNRNRLTDTIFES